MAVSLEHKGKVVAASPYFNIGCHGYRISTKSPDAQAWFDHGLTWAYSFNHRESATCFQQVISHDPNMRHRVLGRCVRIRTELQQSVDGIR